MADNPIVFAFANPVPEISYEDAMDSRPDVLMSTGRSDYPNQINNVIGFPIHLPWCTDVHARAINEEMKMAAVHAIADLAKQPVPDVVNDVYHVNDPYIRSQILHSETCRSTFDYRSFCCRS